MNLTNATGRRFIQRQTKKQITLWMRLRHFYWFTKTAFFHYLGGIKYGLTAKEELVNEMVEVFPGTPEYDTATMQEVILQNLPVTIVNRKPSKEKQKFDA